MTDAPNTDQSDAFDPRLAKAVGGPVPMGWREGTLTRAKELESQCAMVMADNRRQPNSAIIAAGIQCHLDAARQAAERAELVPKRRFWFIRNGTLRERALSNLYAAEANLLTIAPASYVLGQLPSLLRHVRAHLKPADPRLQEFERIAKGLSTMNSGGLLHREKRSLEAWERVRIVSITRGASSEALREQVRVRSFRNVLAITAVAMTLLAIALVVVGFRSPRLISMCFAPEEGGKATVVCPTAESASFDVSKPPSDEVRKAIEHNTAVAEKEYDIFLVELVGLTAAGVASATAIRGMRGSSERYGVPVMLAALKLPTGAVTAVLGMLLVRGEFVPGLSALDTPAQILAWALVFGYAQQLFTRLVDRQGQTVLDSVRGADKPQPAAA